jgi:hypothetical protein
MLAVSPPRPLPGGLFAIPSSAGISVASISPQDLPSSGAGGVPLAAAAAGHELQWLEARDAEEHGASSSTGSSGAHPASLVGTGRADAGLPAGALVGGGSTKSGAERGLGVVAAGVESPVVHPSAARRVHFAHP